MPALDLTVPWQMEDQQRQASPSPPASTPSMASWGREICAQHSSHLAAAIAEWHVASDHHPLSAIVSREWQEHPEGDSSTQLRMG